MRKKSVTKENIAPVIVCSAPWRLTKVKPLPNYEVEVEFNDGVYGLVEMVKLIMSDKAGVFAALKDRNIHDPRLWILTAYWGISLSIYKFGGLNKKKNKQ